MAWKCLSCSPGEWAKEAKLINSVATFGAGTALAASGTEILYIDLGLFLATCDSNWPMVQGDFSIKVKFPSGDLLVDPARLSSQTLSWSFKSDSQQG